MGVLRKAEAEGLLAFVGDAHTVDGPEPFTTELLDRLTEVTQSEFATYFEFVVESPTAHPSITVTCSRSQRYPAVGWPRFREAPEWAVRPPGDVILWSDGLQRAARWRFEGLPPWARTFDVVDCAWTTASAGASERGVVSLFRQGRDFTGRDRRALVALGQHFTALIRNARARRRLADLTAVAGAVDDASPRGYVLLRGEVEPEYVSPAARRILDSWFVEPVRGLPTLVEDWLRSGARRGPLDVERGSTRLVVEAPTPRALVLTEERVVPATLTAREQDVLRWLAAGKSTNEIARELWVTPATVSKHLHHIYRKLGVTSRTAALAAVDAHVRTSRGGVSAHARMSSRGQTRGD